MDAAITLRRARAIDRTTLRELARRAGTSHSTLAAYEAARKDPRVATVDRIVRCSGCDLLVELRPRPGGVDAGDRGRELAEVLELAAQFPARHGVDLDYPPFGAR